MPCLVRGEGDSRQGGRASAGRRPVESSSSLSWPFVAHPATHRLSSAAFGDASLDRQASSEPPSSKRLFFLCRALEPCRLRTPLPTAAAAAPSISSSARHRVQRRPSPLASHHRPLDRPRQSSNSFRLLVHRSVSVRGRTTRPAGRSWTGYRPACLAALPPRRRRRGPRRWLTRRAVRPLRKPRPPFAVSSSCLCLLIATSLLKLAASSRLTSFLRNPPPSHTHIPPSLAGSLLLESQHSPFHRRTLSRKDPSGGPRRPSFSSTFSDGRVTLAGGNASSGHCPTLQSPTEEASPNDACSRSTSRTSSSSGSGSGSSDDSGSGGRHDSGSSSGEMTSSGSPSEDDGSQSSPSGQHAVGQQGRREYFPEDYLLSPWLTPQEFDKSTPSITRREMEARLGSMASYFDHD